MTKSCIDLRRFSGPDTIKVRVEYVTTEENVYRKYFSFQFVKDILFFFSIQVTFFIDEK